MITSAGQNLVGLGEAYEYEGGEHDDDGIERETLDEVADEHIHNLE